MVFIMIKGAFRFKTSTKIKSAKINVLTNKHDEQEQDRTRAIHIAKVIHSKGKGYIVAS